ncbi:MAG: hypothetical protein GY744_20075 [Gammaproteobacteria bacterium]|nr:hypothetical protein [Gammaproteobacteria bacterium]
MNILQNKEIESEEYNVNFNQEDLSVKKLGNIGEYESITERPLFVESREKSKKVVKKKKVKRKPVIEDLKVQALGIALTNEGILAVIKDLKNGKIIRLRIKEKIYGWSLDGVSEDSFTFSKGEQGKVINFKGK